VVPHAARCWGAANTSGISDKPREMKFQIHPDDFKGKKKPWKFSDCKISPLALGSKSAWLTPSHSAVTKPREHFTRTKVAGW